MIEVALLQASINRHLPKKLLLTLSLLLLSLLLFGQSKMDYLRENSLDLNDPAVIFPQEKAKIIGFGALHGSAKTEKAAMCLLHSIMNNDTPISYYIMETDCSIGHYFNKYLQNGDSLLLKDLVEHYGIRVPQERSIEVYEKWKKLRQLNASLDGKNKITVVGVDAIVSYKYTFKHLLELLDYDVETWPTLQTIQYQVQLDTMDYSPYYESHAKQLMRAFIAEYEANPLVKTYEGAMILNHLINNIHLSFDKYDREETIFNNYMTLSKVFDFKTKKQFVRYGFFHIEKEREYQNYPSFFGRLIENEVHKREEIITVMGYLTNSEVLWEVKYGTAGNYLRYTRKAGYGISDYWREYFRGIKKLKKTQISDITLFRLNHVNSPYTDGKPDLIQLKMIFGGSNKAGVKGKSTTDFIDYALLISDSKAARPIDLLSKTIK